MKKLIILLMLIIPAVAFSNGGELDYRFNDMLWECWYCNVSYYHGEKPNHLPSCHYYKGACHWEVKWISVEGCWPNSLKRRTCINKLLKANPEWEPFSREYMDNKNHIWLKRRICE